VHVCRLIIRCCLFIITCVKHEFVACVVESGDTASDVFSTRHITEELCEGLLLFNICTVMYFDI